MDIYKKVIARRMVLFGAIIIVAVILGICHSFGIYFATISDDVSNFQQGLLTAICFLSIITFSKYATSIKNEKKLQMLYNKEHDERQMLIRQKAGMPMLMITSAMIIFAGIIVGYFNETAFVTLIIAAICQMTIGAVVKVYYMRKFG